MYTFPTKTITDDKGGVSLLTIHYVEWPVSNCTHGPHYYVSKEQFPQNKDIWAFSSMCCYIIQGGRTLFVWYFQQQQKTLHLSTSHPLTLYGDGHSRHISCVTCFAADWKPPSRALFWMKFTSHVKCSKTTRNRQKEIQKHVFCFQKLILGNEKIGEKDTFWNMLKLS